MKGVIKKAIIFIVLIIIVVVLYSLFAKKPEIQGSLTSTPAAGVDPKLSSDTQAILSLLQSISNLKLDTNIFERPSYLALEDQNKQILEDLNPGRYNPFAPIGIDQEALVSTPVSSEVSGQLNILNDLGSAGSVQGGSNTSTSETSSTIVTIPASAVSKNTAILKGELVTANVGAERYFEYGLSETNLSFSSNKVVQSTVGTFSYTASNLIPNTTYYFQAVVKIGSVILRGQVQSFKTLP
ncbi:MAG TPA: fibronectin type III domain-containing protein [Candidatus Paceibacterota bacterium]|nr:fibronectin type III domain-containing protein [Candidatus Paceibacterota bacterium]